MSSPEARSTDLQDVLGEDTADAEKLTRLNELLGEVNDLVESMVDPRAGASAVHALDNTLELSRARWAQNKARMSVTLGHMAMSALRNRN